MPSRTNAQAVMASQLARGAPDFGVPDSPQDMIAGIHARRDHKWLSKVGWSPMSRQADVLRELSEQPEDTREEMMRRALGARIGSHPDLDSDGESRYVHEMEAHLGPSSRQREAADRYAQSPEGRRRQAESDQGLLGQLEAHHHELSSHVDEHESWIAHSPAGPHRDALEGQLASYRSIVRQLDAEANLARERLEEYSRGY